jgi:hypothetical protein
MDASESMVCNPFLGLQSVHFDTKLCAHLAPKSKENGRNNLAEYSILSWIGAASAQYNVPSTKSLETQQLLELIVDSSLIR